METLQTTIELMDLQDAGSDEIDSDFEREMLSDDNRVSSKQTNQQINDRPSDLDDRIVEMEFQTLQTRINHLIDQNVPFGQSGLVASAVACKDLTPLEAKQLKSNAIDISAFTNQFLSRFTDPSYMGLATLNLVSDDLYQARFS